MCGLAVEWINYLAAALDTKINALELVSETLGHKRIQLTKSCKLMSVCPWPLASMIKEEP